MRIYLQFLQLRPLLICRRLLWVEIWGLRML
ncbi:hypothetical protein Gohar_015533 [Gossypium harknessii]|uniref:Uncharacterized protein n=1 Tax=Gossypium harknessii TaxID=34285 RepID=A0A7J9G014_9ROSI|nr:hypothetical protein [Gossypium harknessii]